MGIASGFCSLFGLLAVSVMVQLGWMQGVCMCNAGSAHLVRPNVKHWGSEVLGSRHTAGVRVMTRCAIARSEPCGLRRIDVYAPIARQVQSERSHLFNDDHGCGTTWASKGSALYRVWLVMDNRLRFLQKDSA